MKIFMLINFLVYMFLSFTPNFALAEERLSYYAKITLSNVYFYQSANENEMLFEIPTSYFVLLTDEANDEFYMAKYGDILGFVKKSEVTPMNGTPKSPYATTYTCRITSMSGLSLMSKPTFESETLENFEFLENKIYYYGKKQGQEFFPNSTDIWIYCKYSHNNSVKFGYIFSYYCDFPSNIKENKEYFSEITEKLNFTSSNAKASSLSDSIKAIIVLSVAIPALIVTYYVLTKGKKTKKHHSRRKDYYELSENDLN